MIFEYLIFRLLSDLARLFHLCFIIIIIIFICFNCVLLDETDVWWHGVGVVGKSALGQSGNGMGV